MPLVSKKGLVAQSAKARDDGKLVSNVILDRLASNQAGKISTEDAPLTMPRLHKVISAGLAIGCRLSLR